MFEFSLGVEVNSNINSGVIELKLCEVNFADKCSGAMLAPSAVSTPNVNEEVAKYPDAELASQGVLGLPLS